MNKSIKSTIIILAIITTQPAFSEGIFYSAECHQLDSNNVKLTFKNKKTISLPTNPKDCNSEYIYSISQDDVTTVLAGPGPDELGPNAQNDVYVILSNGEKAKNIGSIPVTANPIDKGHFKDIIQSGGSIFESIYTITNNSIVLEPESLELIFSDTQCILETKDSKQCKSFSGKYESPIFIANNQNKKILQEKSRCRDLANKIGK